jgi:ABC-type multidrug transport system permease subunit
MAVLAAGTAVLYVLFCGFLIPRPDVPIYFIWIHYLSPIKVVCCL